MFEIDRIIHAALEEDIGLGDITTEATVEKGVMARAEFVAKDDFVLAGIDVAQRVFATLDPTVSFEKLLCDGQSVTRGEVIAWLKGEAAVLLKGERVALNLLQRMSGIATLTARFVSEVAHTQATIVDTRKTVPGLRILDKHAVRMGGGKNHRIGLFDGVLIKENHVAAAGGIQNAVDRARQRVSHVQKIEIETRDLDEVQQALTAGAEVLLLDNMDLETLLQAVELCRGKALTEASGGVNLDTVRQIAETGVDYISIGALTHSPRAMDVSMLFAQ